MAWSCSVLLRLGTLWLPSPILALSLAFSVASYDSHRRQPCWCDACIAILSSPYPVKHCVQPQTLDPASARSDCCLRAMALPLGLLYILNVPGFLRHAATAYRALMLMVDIRAVGAERDVARATALL